jgi:hypothetical protein
MNKTRLIIILIGGILLSSCNTPLSETALQTAVSQAIMTSSAEEATDSEASTSLDGAENMVPKKDYDEVETRLSEAQLELTIQAQRITDLQAELDQLYPLLTPTITTEPPTPTLTNTPQKTATLNPTATQEGGLLFNQKYVVAVGNTPVYTFDQENDAGYPIMQKVEPIKKFDAGARIIVSIYPVRADGGQYFYLVIGPQHGGFYIRVDEVQDYTG